VRLPRRLRIHFYWLPQHAREIAAFIRGIDQRHRVRTKGIDSIAGSPMMLHAWVTSD
jgi:hypothetical protein